MKDRKMKSNSPHTTLLSNLVCDLLVYCIAVQLDSWLVQKGVEYVVVLQRECIPPIDV